MKFARIVFLLAGIYGIVVIAPLFVLEGLIDALQPPAITHPEYFYGFVGIGLVWQFCFLLIASDPLRYRSLMLLAALEKATGIIFVALVLLHRSPPSMLIGLVDSALGVLFLLAYNRTAASTLATLSQNPLHE